MPPATSARGAASKVVNSGRVRADEIDMSRRGFSKRLSAARRAGRRSRFDRALAITLVSGFGLLLILGLVFSIAYGSQQITTNATALHKADESLRAATVARAQLALATHMSTVDRTFGTSSSEAIDISLGEARTALEDLTIGIAELQADEAMALPAIQAAADKFSATGLSILKLLEEGRSDAAQQASSEQFSPQFSGLLDTLVVVRDELADRVSDSDALLGRIGNVARFLVAFLVPAAVIFIYRELIRRQQRQSDLEGRLEAERQLSKAREEFIANASHELRTPLTGITGLALLLAEDPALSESESAIELLDLIISESGDLARMVEDLLTTARLDAGALHFSFEDVDIAAEAIETTNPMTQAGLVVPVHCEPGVVRADRLRLRQILRNLLSNARKYGGPNTRIEGWVEGRTYVCAVIDDGGGIPGDLEGRLFERFVHQGNTTAVTGSVGLGLSIVHALTHGMGGSVSHERKGGETHFIVRLPLARDIQSGRPAREAVAVAEEPAEAP